MEAPLYDALMGAFLDGLVDEVLDSGMVAVATTAQWGASERAATQLVRGYARFLMGHRPKSPAGDGLSIQANQFLRYKTYCIVRERGQLRRDVPQWERKRFAALI